MPDTLDVWVAVAIVIAFMFGKYESFLEELIRTWIKRWQEKPHPPKDDKGD